MKIFRPSLLKHRKSDRFKDATGDSRASSKTPILPDGGAVSRFENGEREPNLFVISRVRQVSEDQSRTTD